MRVYCNKCDTVATIQATSQISSGVRNLYCICQNPACAHSFVCTLSYSHTLSPSALDLPESVREAIKSYSPKEITSLLSLLDKKPPAKATGEAA